MSTTYCRHIRPSGRRCQTAALQGRPLCYHHANTRAHLRALQPLQDGTSNITRELTSGQLAEIQREPLMADYYSNTRGPVILDFPPLEDANAVQLALSMILTLLGHDRLDPRRAASMLYNLQIAAGNVRSVTHDETHAVRDLVQDEAGNLLAPDEDPEEVRDSKQFFQDFDEREKEINKDRDEDEIADEKDEDDF